MNWENEEMRSWNSRTMTDKLEVVFQVLFLIYTFLGFNSITFGSRIISLFMWISYLLGAFLLIVRLRNWKEYVKMPGLPCLVVMCAVCVVSILANTRYDLKRNGIYLIFWMFYFFLFYAQSRSMTVDRIKKRFYIMGHVICLLAFVLAGISLVTLALQYSEVLMVRGEEVTRGFIYGRLYGAYLTPNGGAVVSVIVIVLSIHFIGMYRNTAYTIFTLLNILVQFLYLVFSDSRSGQLCLTCGAAVYVLFSALSSNKIKPGGTKILVVTILVAGTAAAAWAAPKLTQQAYNKAVVLIAEWSAKETANAASSAGTADLTDAGQTETQIIDAYAIDRGYDLSGDISNRRFDIWKSGLEIFAATPWLGTTFSGFQSYAAENLPETYIISNDYRKMETFDNDFINLLVSNGVFGFLAFLGFVIWVLTFLFRNFFRMRHRDGVIPVMMGVCMAAAVFSMFASGVLYMRSPFSILFWLSLGSLVTIVSQDTKEK